MKGRGRLRSRIKALGRKEVKGLNRREKQDFEIMMTLNRLIWGEWGESLLAGGLPSVWFFTRTPTKGKVVD